MKILITGGAGFIGSHVAKLLLDQNHEVIIFDNLSKSKIEFIDPRAEFIEGDLKDQTKLTECLSGVDLVMHFASLIEVSESVKNPLLFAENNILGTIHLLESMKTAKVKKIIFSSSATVYGPPTKLPLTESSPILANNPYGASKIASESFITTYHFLYDFDVTILRYFNPYGPGEMHSPETHAIPSIIKAALNKKPIPVFWQGEQIRDFIYIEDLAEAHTATINLTGLNIFNVGGDKGIKVIDILNKVSDILGYKLEIDQLGERAGDVAANYASSQLLKQKTGWQTKVDLDAGLKKTIDYYKQSLS
ncbi:UDP-glucose 4-epimerase GalE [Candidatus Daviesbacteria bacterium]|nr:UDP-glucose 4-epimerase GalE [Candidatus Daviesbacteria bacterium]